MEISTQHVLTSKQVLQDTSKTERPITVATGDHLHDTNGDTLHSKTLAPNMRSAWDIPTTRIQTGTGALLATPPAL